MNQKDNVFYQNNPKLYLQLKKLCLKYRRQCTRMIMAQGRKRDKHRKWKLKYLYDWIMQMSQLFKEIPPSLIEKCKWILEGRIDYPYCKNPKCSNKIRKLHGNGKYASHCCSKCAGADPDVLKERENTCLKIYGSTNVFSSDYGKNKMMQTCLRKYNVKYSGASKEKIKNTKLSNLKKYGVENVNQVPEIKQRAVKTSIQRNGQLFNYSIYKYDDMLFDSAWEVAVYIFLKENNIDFRYHDTHITFQYTTKDGKNHIYYPDFVIEGNVYEIKGSQFFDMHDRPYNRITKEFWYEKYECMIKNNVTIISENEIKPYLNYVNKKYGNHFLSSLKIRK